MSIIALFSYVFAVLFVLVAEGVWRRLAAQVSILKSEYMYYSDRNDTVTECLMWVNISWQLFMVSENKTFHLS